MGVLGRYPVTLPHMHSAMACIVQCLADDDSEVQFVASQVLIKLLDRTHEEEEEEVGVLQCVLLCVL